MLVFMFGFLPAVAGWTLVTWVGRTWGDMAPGIVTLFGCYTYRSYIGSLLLSTIMGTLLCQGQGQGQGWCRLRVGLFLLLQEILTLSQMFSYHGYNSRTSEIYSTLQSRHRCSVTTVTTYKICSTLQTSRRSSGTMVTIAQQTQIYSALQFPQLFSYHGYNRKWDVTLTLRLLVIATSFTCLSCCIGTSKTQDPNMKLNTQKRRYQ